MLKQEDGKVLVTGATGHIGNVLVRELVRRGQQVRALVLPGENLQPLAGVDVEVVHGDVLDVASLETACTGVKDVYHLAGVISIQPGCNPLVRRINIDGTKNVIAAAWRVGVRRLVYTGSIHAFSRLPKGCIIDETAPIDPSNPVGEYDRSKAEATLAVITAVQQGLDAVIVCPTGVIGPYDFRLSDMGRFILDSMKNVVQFYVNGAYDFVDVRDVARGEIVACEKGRKGEAYILGGEKIGIFDLMTLVHRLTGRHPLKLKLPFGLARWSTRFVPAWCKLTRARPLVTHYSIETVASNCDISHAKAGRELDYAPRSLADTLRDTIQWLVENRALLVNI